MYMAITVKVLLTKEITSEIVKLRMVSKIYFCSERDSELSAAKTLLLLLLLDAISLLF